MVEAQAPVPARWIPMVLRRMQVLDRPVGADPGANQGPLCGGDESHTEQQGPAGPEAAVTLPQCFLDIREMFQHVECDDVVKRPVGERQVRQTLVARKSTGSPGARGPGATHQQFERAVMPVHRTATGRHAAPVSELSRQSRLHAQNTLPRWHHADRVRTRRRVHALAPFGGSQPSLACRDTPAGPVKVIACIEDLVVIDKILTHLRDKAHKAPTAPLLVQLPLRPVPAQMDTALRAHPVSGQHQAVGAQIFRGTRAKTGCSPREPG